MKWAIGPLVGLLFMTLGCTQGVPTISTTENLPAISLESDYFESKNLRLYDLILVGRVSKLVDRLEVSLDDGGTWKVLEAGQQASSIGGFSVDKSSCIPDCRFDGSLHDIGTLWTVLDEIPYEGEVTGMLRGSGVFGYTEITRFKIKRLKRGFTSVGSVGLNHLGAKVRTLTGSAAGFRVESGRLESRALQGVVGASVKGKGVLQ